MQNEGGCYKGCRFMLFVLYFYEYIVLIVLDIILLDFVICNCFFFVFKRKDVQFWFEMYCMVYWEFIKLKFKFFV